MLSNHPSTIKAHHLLMQIEDEDNSHSHWLLMALKSLLIERPNLKVEQLVNEIELLCPATMMSVSQRIKNY